MSRKNERLFVFAVFLFCLSLRLAFISQKNLWFDEIFSWHLTEGTLIDIINGTSSDIHPPFYYFILKIWKILFGDSVLIMRLLSVLFTSSAVFFIYPIAKKVLGSIDSFLVLLLYSVSPLNLFYSQEVRMASLNLLLDAGSICFFIKLIEIEGNWKNYFKNLSTYAYILFAVLSIYTHYFSFFVVLAQAVYLLFQYKSRFKKYIPYLVIVPVVLLSYWFWFPIMIKQVSGGQPWRRGQNVYEVLEQVYVFLNDLSMGLYYSYTSHTLVRILSVLVILITLLVILGLIIIASKKKAADVSVHLNYALLIFLVSFIPLAASVIISFKQWIEFFRYLSFVIPYILIAGLVGLKVFNRKTQLISVTVLLCINLFGVYLYYSSDFKNNDYRQIMSTIQSESSGNDKIYVYPHYYSWGVDYYVKQKKYQIPLTENYGWEFDSLYGHIKKTNPQKFWFVLDYSSNDTATYGEKVNALKSEYNVIFKRVYHTVPFNAKLFMFNKKNLKP